MPHVEYKGVKIKYKLKPLYLGLKRIDKNVARENLLLFNEIAIKFSLNFILAYGTALGAVRENDFISHDEDVDLAIADDSFPILFRMIQDLTFRGFEIVRWDRRGLLSISRKDEYIDIYIFKRLCENVRVCCGEPVLDAFLLSTKKISFQGGFFSVPKDVELYLKFNYGTNWNIPIPWTDFEVSIFEKFFFTIKEHLKAHLPDILFYPLVRPLERNIMKKYIDNGVLVLPTD